MKTIIRIDASSIKDSGCLRRLVLMTVEGYTGHRVSNDMAYGSAGHRGVEVYELTKGDDSATISAALDYWNKVKDDLYFKEKKQHLNAAHLMLSMQKFCKEAKTNKIFLDNETLVIKGQPLVEKKFSIKIYEDDMFIVLLQGTIDRIIRMRSNGAIMIGDWKFTAAYSPDDYFEGYKMSPQLRTYVWAIKKLAEQNPNTEAGQMINKLPKLGAYIFGAFHKAPTGIDFYRSEPFWFTPQDMQEYETLLMALVNRLIIAARKLKATGTYPLPEGMLNGNCIAPFGGLCKYFQGCSAVVGLNSGSPQDRIMRGIFEGYMKRKEYRPLTFGGEGKV